MRASPRVFRILLPAKNLAQAKRFYERLLGIRGRVVAEGRLYFDCGRVIVGILDYLRQAELPSGAESIYFGTRDLESLHRRAEKLGCLAPGFIHWDPESPLGEIVVRPWGERSFYVEDPSGNSLCFVDERTLFRGTPMQIAALRRASRRRR